MPGPLIWAAAGGLPATTRLLSTVMAASPPPPATAKSFQVWPLPCMIFFSSPTDLASPPEVHQCRTSTSPALAAEPSMTKATAVASFESFNIMTPSKKGRRGHRGPQAIFNPERHHAAPDMLIFH